MGVTSQQEDQAQAPAEGGTLNAANIESGNAGQPANLLSVNGADSEPTSLITTDVDMRPAEEEAVPERPARDVTLPTTPAFGMVPTTTTSQLEHLQSLQNMVMTLQACLNSVESFGADSQRSKEEQGLRTELARNIPTFSGDRNDEKYLEKFYHFHETVEVFVGQSGLTDAQKLLVISSKLVDGALGWWQSGTRAFGSRLEACQRLTITEFLREFTKQYMPRRAVRVKSEYL